MPDGDVEDVELDQNGKEVEDEDGKITEQAKDLKKLNRYQQDILRLQHEKEQLLRQAAARNKAEQMQRAIRQTDIERERLVHEIQCLHGGAAGDNAGRGGGNMIIPDTILPDEDEEAFDSTSPL